MWNILTVSLNDCNRFGWWWEWLPLMNLNWLCQLYGWTNDRGMCRFVLSTLKWITHVFLQYQSRHEIQLCRHRMVTSLSLKSCGKIKRFRWPEAKRSFTWRGRGGCVSCHYNGWGYTPSFIQKCFCYWIQLRINLLIQQNINQASRIASLKFFQITSADMANVCCCCKMCKEVLNSEMLQRLHHSFQYNKICTAVNSLSSEIGLFR